MFERAKLSQIGDQMLPDAKKYLVVHNQELNDEAAMQYRYKFPYAPAKKG